MGGVRYTPGWVYPSAQLGGDLRRAAWTSLTLRKRPPQRSPPAEQSSDPLVMASGQRLRAGLAQRGRHLDLPPAALFNHRLITRRSGTVRSRVNLSHGLPLTICPSVRPGAARLAPLQGTAGRVPPPYPHHAVPPAIAPGTGASRTRLLRRPRCDSLRTARPARPVSPHRLSQRVAPPPRAGTDSNVKNCKIRHACVRAAQPGAARCRAPDAKCASRPPSWNRSHEYPSGNKFLRRPPAPTPFTKLCPAVARGALGTAIASLNAGPLHRYLRGARLARRYFLPGGVGPLHPYRNPRASFRADNA